MPFFKTFNLENRSCGPLAKNTGCAPNIVGRSSQKWHLAVKSCGLGFIYAKKILNFLHHCFHYFHPSISGQNQITCFFVSPRMLSFFLPRLDEWAPRSLYRLTGDCLQLDWYVWCQLAESAVATHLQPGTGYPGTAAAAGLALTGKALFRVRRVVISQDSS